MHGVVKSLPDLFTVAVILVLTRIVARIVSRFFRGVERGTSIFQGFHPETARATRRLSVFVIWIFALTVAYPYIPGSNTEGFRGIGVLAGIVVSLGSAGLVNQIMSGLVIVYSRAFRVNDYVSIGDTEGLVTDLGLLSTKLLTVQKEEIVIPNATLVGMKAVNYTRLAKDQGSVASTSVTIGYDAPWRRLIPCCCWRPAGPPAFPSSRHRVLYRGPWATSMSSIVCWCICFRSNGLKSGQSCFLSFTVTYRTFSMSTECRSCRRIS